MPANVGGRFSVLSAVGLLPAALDRHRHRAAARTAPPTWIERCRTAELDDQSGRHVRHAAVPRPHRAQCADPRHDAVHRSALSRSADWFRQLWAESLGKRNDRDGSEVFTGPTPVKALGATDQHSQVQLYMEGPFDKTVTFLSV